MSPPRPNLFVVGAPKCGTTALTRYLEQHPAVFMAPRKDLHRFGRDLDFRNRPRIDEADYLRIFADADPAATPVLAESSVWYLRSTTAAAEIRAFSPAAKAIALVRHPTRAAHALWAQNRLNGLGDDDLDDFGAALAAEADRAAGRRIPAHCPLPLALQYRDAVRFSDQLARYRTHFGDDLMVLVQEEMQADTAGTLRRVFAWLGIDPEVPVDTRRVNTAKAVRSEGLRRALAWTPAGLKGLVPAGLRRGISRRLRHLNSRHAPRTPLDPALRARLDAELAPEVARIEALLGRRVAAWHAGGPPPPADPPLSP